MRKTLPALVLFALFSMTGLCPQASAQWAVIDVGAITQLIQEVQQMQQALQTAQNQLNQAQQEYQSMTGTARDAESPERHQPQLPADRLGRSCPTALGLSRSSRQINYERRPDAAQVAALSPAEQQQLNAARSNAALLQVATQQALRHDQQPLCLRPDS